MDQYHDTCHKELIKIAKDLSLPQYALEADLERDSIKKLSSHDFAFPEARYFPIHTKEDTLLSSAFFLTKKAEFGKYQNSIYERLRSASISYNILEDFNNLASFEKKASAKEYALPELKKFPINTASEVTKAAEWLEKQKNSFPEDIYKEVKTRIEKKASALGIVCNTAKEVQFDLKKAAEYMTHRAKKTSDPMLKKAMASITKAMIILEESPSEDMMSKLAEFIDRYDRLTGINRRGSYLSGMESLTVEAVLEKAGSAKLSLEGKQYTKDQLEKVSVDQLRNGLGDSFVNAVTSSDGKLDLEKFAEIVDTLPLPDKKILAMYLPA